MTSSIIAHSLELYINLINIYINTKYSSEEFFKSKKINEKEYNENNINKSLKNLRDENIFNNCITWIAIL